MSSTSTSRLGLFKPTPGSAEPFRTSDVNSNMDKIDAEAVAVDGRLDSIEANGWVTAARLASTLSQNLRRQQIQRIQIRLQKRFLTQRQQPITRNLNTTIS